jgi:hypothetical protein
VETTVRYIGQLMLENKEGTRSIVLRQTPSTLPKLLFGGEQRHEVEGVEEDNEGINRSSRVSTSEEKSGTVGRNVT